MALDTVRPEAPLSVAHSAPRGLVVMDGGQKERLGRTAKRIELAARRDEALAHVERCRPLVRRMEMVAVEVGPAAWQTVAALHRELDRFERQWSDPEDAA